MDMDYTNEVVKVNKRIVFWSLTILMALGAPQVWAVPLLVDWAFNDNGSVFTATDNSTGDLPGHFDISNFDWDTGLGTITIAYAASGNHSFTSFFDHEIVRGSNTFFNEYGEVYGTPEVGQSWEIDEPGWVFGDIYDNALYGQLDDSNSVPAGLEDDMSMAMGWDFFLQEGETVLITLTLSDLLPAGFYLAQHDPDGSHYFSSSLTIESGTTPVPEPASALLLGLALIFLLALRHRDSLT